MNFQIHSVLFSKQQWSTDQARKWLHNHNLVPLKRVHVTQDNYRYRIVEPRKGAKYITKKTSEGITLVLLK